MKEFNYYIISYSNKLQWQKGYTMLTDYEHTIKLFGFTIARWRTGYHYN